MEGSWGSVKGGDIRDLIAVNGTKRFPLLRPLNVTVDLFMAASPQLGLRLPELPSGGMTLRVGTLLLVTPNLTNSLLPIRLLSYLPTVYRHSEYGCWRRGTEGGMEEKKFLPRGVMERQKTTNHGREEDDVKNVFWASLSQLNGARCLQHQRHWKCSWMPLFHQPDRHSFSLFLHLSDLGFHFIFQVFLFKFSKWF